jgi:hypothetical protein
MTNTKLHQARYLYRLHLWLSERFPYINFISGFIIFFFAKSVIVLTNSNENDALHFQDVFAMLIPTLHLFLLRVFDEHKDYLSDQIHYPHRILQKGIFTLAEVRQLGYGAFGLQILCFLALKPTPLAYLSFMFLWLWTFLMIKEFFAKDFLKQKLLLYAWLHQMVTPILFLTLLILCAGAFNFSKAWGLSLMLSVALGWLYENARKTKGQEEETGDLSYSQIFGSKGSVLILFISTALTCFLIYELFQTLNIENLIYTNLIGAFLALAGLTNLKYLKQPTAKNRKKNEGVVALISIYAFLTPITIAFF